jgi:UDP-N-acetylglucosamine--N-acetylmuramyl-(pentapeptide) pyrophosphoryl-undecaprenol N-acetylglucosamine transferase
METATVGLPMIFVPLPHGNGEQARNADFLIEGGAGVLIRDADLSADTLLAEALPLLADPARLAAMSAATRNLVPADAAGELARRVLMIAGEVR